MQVVASLLRPTKMRRSSATGKTCAPCLPAWPSFESARMAGWISCASTTSKRVAAGACSGWALCHCPDAAGALLCRHDRVDFDGVGLRIQRAGDSDLLGGEFRRRLLIAQNIGHLAVIQDILPAHSLDALGDAFRVRTHVHGLVIGFAAHVVRDDASKCLLVACGEPQSR